MKLQGGYSQNVSTGHSGRYTRCHNLESYQFEHSQKFRLCLCVYINIARIEILDTETDDTKRCRYKDTVFCGLDVTTSTHH